MTTTPSPTAPAPIRLTREQVAADLRALAAERPDYIYDQPTFVTELADGAQVEHTACAYFTADGQPSCIVGHVLARHGGTLEHLEGSSAPGTITQSLNYDSRVPMLVAAGVLDIDSATERVLCEAQEAQDGEKPWREAVALALYAAGEEA